MSNREERKLKYYLAQKGRYETEKALRKARRQMKNNLRANKPRRWRSDDFDEFDEFEFEARLPARTERKRRKERRPRTIVEPDELEPVIDGREPALKGVVTEVGGGLYRVDLGTRSLLCSLRGTLAETNTGFTNPVVVGDKVRVTEVGPEQGVVEDVLPRRSVLARPDLINPSLQQAIVANIDQLLIVAAWRNPHIWPELIDRYLITAQRHSLVPVICLNKLDLADDVSECQVTLQPYIDLGYRVLFTSVVTGEGVDALRKVLKHKTTVLAGLSGVGKSSLLAAVEPGLQLRIEQVSDSTGEGKHTTTQATWHKLEMGGAVVDTPGIREFGVNGLHPGELARFYAEIDGLAHRCRFADCTHLHEPDCAVQDAVQKGAISTTRYENYQKIFESLSG